MLKFETKTGTIEIDRDECEKCDSYACVKACSHYGRNILKLQGGRPVLRYDPDEAKKRDNECLACEEACRVDGLDCINIILPIRGLGGDQ